MELLVGASLVAAFIAGIAALFAPCCITVLLPSYFASIFRERSKVFLMTFIFFLGILIVFLPLGLGAAALGQIFSRFHNIIFAVGGVFLVLLGLLLLAGKHLSLPFATHPILKQHNALSVFTLGIFSGIATTCCAPVLAGVLALSVLPASVLWGAVYTLSYVLGMVIPLFLIALFLDKINFTQKFMTIRKPIEYSIGGKKITLTIAELISGITFLIMGIIILFLAFTNRLFIHSDYQLSINLYLARFLNLISDFIKFVPEYIWVLLFLVLLIIIIKIFINQLKREMYEQK